MSDKTRNMSHVTWIGNLKEGKGSISTDSEALTEEPYGFNKRFTGENGTNPEELIAAAHASCFTMALTQMLEENDLSAPRLETTAEVVLCNRDGDFIISDIYLKLTGDIGDIDNEEFESLAEDAKNNCPVSKLFNTNIHLDIELKDKSIHYSGAKEVDGFLDVYA